MRRSLLRNSINAISGVTLALAACRPVKQVSALGKQIDGEFHRAILVSVDRRSHLILVIPPATVDTTKPDSVQRDTTDPATFARQVAVYAVEHYQHKSALKSVTVILDAGDDSTMTFGNYTWSADDLSGKSHVAAGTPGEKSD